MEVLWTPRGSIRPSLKKWLAVYSYKQPKKFFKAKNDFDFVSHFSKSSFFSVHMHKRAEKLCIKVNLSAHVPNILRFLHAHSLFCTVFCTHANIFTFLHANSLFSTLNPLVPRVLLLNQCPGCPSASEKVFKATPETQNYL